MSELHFPAGYTFGEHSEYTILRSTPLNKDTKNTFAEVYLAVKTKTRKKFAVKILKPSIIKKFDRVTDDFQIEIKLLMELNHRYVIKIEDFGTLADKDGMPSFYLLTEYIPHGNILSSEYSFPQLINFTLQVCEGLTFLHKNKVIHRDIKPDNILIHESKLVKIVDFGIAKFYAEMLNEGDLVSSVIGAPAYAAPEQMGKSMPITPQVDVYSLGKTLYTMITKKVPVAGVQIKSLPDKYMHYPYSNFLLEVLRKSTEVDPARRYEDINSLKTDLNGLYQMAKRYKKRQGKKGVPVTRRFIKSAAVFLLILLIGSAGYVKRTEFVKLYQKFKSVKFVKTDEDKYEDTLRKGMELFSLGVSEYNHSSKLLEKAVKLNPDDPRPYPYLGRIYDEMGKLKDSIISWEIAVRLAPENLDYKISLGEIYFRAGIYQEAVNEFKKVLEKDPSNKTAKNLLSVIEKSMR
ncbi:protein kinase [bacterium]|nr:protein kinase [bacterium]